MPIVFEKYHGAGNDFVVIDDRDRFFDTEDMERVRLLCHRRLGVGSDGLMLIRTSEEADFEMIFFNPDGSRSLCGNGSRCAVAFARKLGLATDRGTMITTDGIHAYRVSGGEIDISMGAVRTLQNRLDGLFVDTGSPHLVLFVENVDEVDVVTRGRRLRQHPEFSGINGVNVNFVAYDPDGQHKMRTYERGVEAETLSCGTGATAAALALAMEYNLTSEVRLSAPGGSLRVDFDKRAGEFHDIWLGGPSVHVFSGEFHA